MQQNRKISNISASKNLPTYFVHRFFSTKDILHLFQLLNSAYHEFGSLKNLFITGYNSEEENLKSTITNFNKYFLTKSQKEFKELSRGLKFMFPLPEKGSACKRMNLFLRWMVRKDGRGVDFGIWNSISPAILSCPLDVHSGNVARKLGLLTRSQNDLKAVLELKINSKQLGANVIEVN